MTCIVGIRKGRRVYLGADSAGSNWQTIELRKDPKVVKNGEFVIGFCGSFRMGQVLAHVFKPTLPKRDQSLFAFMVSTFVEELRTALKAAGVTEVNNNQEKGGCFLVGYRGRLFCIESDFQVGERLDDFNAIGSGAPFALGSLYSTQRFAWTPQSRIRCALEAAEANNPYVRRPFQQVST